MSLSSDSYFFVVFFMYFFASQIRESARVAMLFLPLKPGVQCLKHWILFFIFPPLIKCKGSH